jgi:hypothetical protein
VALKIYSKLWKLFVNIKRTFIIWNMFWFFLKEVKTIFNIANDGVPNKYLNTYKFLAIFLDKPILEA